MKIKKSESKIYQLLDKNIKDSFCFLFVGHWLRGEHGQDRKAIGTLIETFLKTFATVSKDKQPGLILKTSLGTSSEKYKYEILNRIDLIKDIVCKELQCIKEELPNVYLLHGNLTEQEINELYNHPKVSAMVSFTRGEGYGRPFAEWGAATNKPLIVPNWSGHLDFCKPDSVCLLNGNLEKIHPSSVWENILIPESSWYTVNYTQAVNVLKKVYEQYDYFKRKGNTQHKNIINNFTFEHMVERFKLILSRNVIIKEIPKFIPLKLK